MNNFKFDCQCPSCHHPHKLLYANSMWTCSLCKKTWVFIVNFQLPTGLRKHPGLFEMCQTGRNMRLERYHKRNRQRPKPPKFLDGTGLEDGWIPDDDGPFPFDPDIIP